MSSQFSADRTSAPPLDAAALHGSAAWRRFDNRACHEVPFSQVLTSNDPLVSDLSLDDVSLAGLSEEDYRELGHLRLLEDVFDMPQVTQLCPLASVPDDSFAEYFVTLEHPPLRRISLSCSDQDQLKTVLWKVWRKSQQERARKYWPHGIGGYINEVVINMIRLNVPAQEMHVSLLYCVLHTYGLKPTFAREEYLRQQGKPALPWFDVVKDPAQIAVLINTRSSHSQGSDINDQTIMAWQSSLRQMFGQPQVSDCLGDWLGHFDSRYDKDWPHIKKRHQEIICPRPSDRIQRDTTVEAIFEDIRLHNVLLRYDITTLGDLLGRTIPRLEEFKGFGVVNINTIRSTLATHGIILPENSFDELVIPKHLRE